MSPPKRKARALLASTRAAKANIPPRVSHSQADPQLLDLLERLCASADAISRELGWIRQALDRGEVNVHLPSGTARSRKEVLS